MTLPTDLSNTYRDRPVMCPDCSQELYERNGKIGCWDTCRPLLCVAGADFDFHVLYRLLIKAYKANDRMDFDTLHEMFGDER